MWRRSGGASHVTGSPSSRAQRLTNNSEGIASFSPRLARVSEGLPWVTELKIPNHFARSAASEGEYLSLLTLRNPHLALSLPAPLHNLIPPIASRPNFKMKSIARFVASAILLFPALIVRGEIKVIFDRNAPGAATAAYAFKNVPAPSGNDAAAKAEFVVVDGERDRDSGTPDKLHDGKLPGEQDDPAENFFFAAGTEGGRLLVDLRRAIAVKQINSYSWHPNSRGPQVYTLYASDGSAAGFNPRPENGLDPKSCGWDLLAKVDTRPEHGSAGGQYGVSISDTSGAIGKYRYLLFVMSRTEARDNFGNTFYSEIDVVDRDAPEPPQAIKPPPPAPNLSKTFTTPDGKYQIVIDPSRAADLRDWAFQDLAPVVLKWYPKLVDLLPSDGFEAPTRITIDFGNSRGGFTAITRGTHITCTTDWFRKNLKGEATGCVVHELVHVVQSYHNGRPENSDALPTPGWLTEGIADYVRWFVYEPETHGADISPKRISSVNYDDSYRITANFLDWVTRKYDAKLVPLLNAALRDGDYRNSFWKEHTGHNVNQLDKEWKQSLYKEAKVKSVQ